MTQEQKEIMLHFMNMGVFNMQGKDIIKHTILLQEIASCEIEEKNDTKIS